MPEPDPEVGGRSAGAIVLCGGQSSRMGRSKAMLPFGGVPLIVHVVRRLRDLFDRIAVVAAPDQDLPDLDALVVRDEVPHQGPAAGLAHGLRAAGTDPTFVVACDMGFLNLPLVAHLVAGIGDYDAVLPEWEGRGQPLHAVYRQTVLDPLEQQLANGRPRLLDLFETVRARIVKEDEIRRFDPEGLSFFNVNVPEDYAAAIERLRTRDAGRR